MVDYVRENLPEYEWIHNSTITKGCNRYRPDLRAELTDRLICIECDENSHSKVDYECDSARMFNITQDYGGIPVVFLRLNPDKCDPDLPLEERLEHLCEKIKSYVNMGIEQLPVGYPIVEYMFYNEKQQIKREAQLNEALMALNIH
jgi:hypothetical protein